MITRLIFFIYLTIIDNTFIHVGWCDISRSWFIWNDGIINGWINHMKTRNYVFSHSYIKKVSHLKLLINIYLHIESGGRRRIQWEPSITFSANFFHQLCRWISYTSHIKFKIIIIWYPTHPRITHVLSNYGWNTYKFMITFKIILWFIWNAYKIQRCIL